MAPEQHEPNSLAVRLETAFRTIDVGRTTGFKLVRDGRLPTVTIGARRLVRIVDLERFVSELTDERSSGRHDED